MSMEAPPSLQELAHQSLLRNLPSPRPPLEDLPQHLFLQLFKEAFRGGHKETLQAMVQGWPFARLPLGSLMRQSWTSRICTRITECSVFCQMMEPRNEMHVEILEAVLKGLSLVLTQRAPHRCKLQVLDLRDVHGDFWDLRSKNLSEVYSAEVVFEELTARHAPRAVPKTPFTVLMDIAIEGWMSSDYDACFLSWANKWKAVLHVCCERLTIESRDLYQIERALNSVRLNCIRELEVHAYWNEATMRKFVTYLPQMENLQIFHFSVLSECGLIYPTENESNACIYAHQLGEMKSLQKLYIDNVFFLQGNLHQIFRNPIPLTTLYLKSSRLTESDVQHLAQAPSTRQLQHLLLRDIPMAGFSSEPLPLLLEWVAGTLETLDLDHCELSDEQIRALMPALRCCSQLRTFSCCRNPISMGALKDLLCHTARLRNLSQGYYPLPLQSQKDKDTYVPVHLGGRIGPVGEELIQVLKDIKPSHDAYFSTFYCTKCYRYEFHSLQPDGSWKVTGEKRYYIYLCHKYCNCPE